MASRKNSRKGGLYGRKCRKDQVLHSGRHRPGGIGRYLYPEFHGTELIEDALRFYLGFLTAQKAEDYLLQSLSSVMTGTVQDSENRLARMDFKIAVELSKLSQVIAYSHDIDEDALKRLHLKCLEEVRRINGAIDFESAYKYQKRKT